MDGHGEAVESGEPARPSRRRRWLVRLAWLALLLLAALLVLWTQRKPLATHFIDRELAKRGVTGSYDIAELGVSTQRVENLVIGDPDDPDLTAESAELRTRLGFGIPEVTGIVASGVRLRGELVDGRVSFGQLDRLLPAPSGEPFSFPDIFLALSDARISLATPYGPVGVAVEGEGRLTDGFSGRAALASRRLATGGCSVRRLRLTARIEIEDRRPAVRGPLRGERLSCGDGSLAVAEPRLELDAVLSESFDRWGGEARLSLASLAADGTRIGPARGSMTFDGTADRSSGAFAIEGRRLRAGPVAATGASLVGHFRLAHAGADLAVDGDLGLDDAAVAEARLAALTAPLRGAEGTPLGPLGAALARAAERAAGEFHATASLAVLVGEGGSEVWLTALRGGSASGARIAFEDGEGIRYIVGEGLRVDGALALAGGGFPEAVVELRQARQGAPLEGTARIAPYEVAGARLAMAPVRFSAGTDGTTRIATQVQLSGPLADGRVERLGFPVRGTLGRGGTLAIGGGCIPLSWQRLTVSTLAIGPTRLPLCPVEGGALFRYAPGEGVSGGARIPRPRLTAMLGGSPLAVAASEFRLPLRSAGFVAEDVSARLGIEGQQSTLDIDRLAADFVTGGVAGRYAGAAGQINAVPIRFDESEGEWRFVRGALDVTGEGRVTSTSAPNPLFEPLVTRDLALHLENSLIDMSAALREPEQGRVIADVDLRHDLSTGTGDAVLETPRLAFGEALQPSDLTNIVLGVVAEVDGAVSGTGRIRWDATGVTSEGLYRLDDIDLAAPFGPVKGLDGEVRFTDLLGMVTAPGQVVTAREVNPGVLVDNGVVRYQLLSSSVVRIEGGRWPFAGGQIILEPTTLDFGADRQRRMTFRVEGVDAFRFVEERDFSSIAATGTFNGVLPIVFDAEGGRIDGGVLSSTPDGGTFSYTGEISDVNLGVFGTLAFNALELIRYNEMVLRFDGELDGEMITQVDFTGVTPRISREGQNILVGGLTRQLAELPIRFDITMYAPFQGLAYSVRLLDDPGFLVGEAIRQHRAQITVERDVQAEESDVVP